MFIRSFVRSTFAAAELLLWLLLLSRKTTNENIFAFPQNRNERKLSVRSMRCAEFVRCAMGNKMVHILWEWMLLLLLLISHLIWNFDHFDTDFILSSKRAKEEVPKYLALRKCRAVTAPLRSVSSDYWPNCKWVNQCDNVGTLATHGPSDCGFSFRKLVIIFQWKHPSPMDKSYLRDSKFFHKPLAHFSVVFFTQNLLLECSNICCFFSFFLSLSQ